MKNCKDPNNGGNILRHEDGKVILLDQCGTNVSQIDDWSKDIGRLETDIEKDIEKSEAKAAKTYATALALDGSELSLLDGQETPHVLSTVVLPSGGGGASTHAHAVSCIISNIDPDYVETICEFIADGIKVEAAQVDDNAYTAFTISLTDPTKFVFSTSKPVFYRVSLERDNKFCIQGSDPDNGEYGGVLVTPLDSTSAISVKYLRNFGLYAGQRRAIVEAFADLVEVEGE